MVRPAMASCTVRVEVRRRHPTAAKRAGRVQLRPRRPRRHPQTGSFLLHGPGRICTPFCFAMRHGLVTYTNQPWCLDESPLESQSSRPPDYAC